MRWGVHSHPPQIFPRGTQVTTLGMFESCFNMLTLCTLTFCTLYAIVRIFQIMKLVDPYAPFLLKRHRWQYCMRSQLWEVRYFITANNMADFSKTNTISQKLVGRRTFDYTITLYGIITWSMSANDSWARFRTPTNSQYITTTVFPSSSLFDYILWMYI